MARILISVTHLLGTGHLSRALTLARAFGDAGHDAHVMSGGMPTKNLVSDGVKFHQLPPVKSDGVNFTTLLSEHGTADEDYLAHRKKMALDFLQDVSPDVLITELYPFGRRVLKGEFLAILNAARDMKNPTHILSSIRDILAPPSKPKKALETEAVLAAYYGGVLVHSHEALTPLEKSWPVTDQLRDKLYYTGFVAPPPAGAHPDGTGLDEVLVTAGGGDVGMPLFRAAIDAAALSVNTRWRVLVGGANAAENIAELKARAASQNVTVEPTRSDFRQMLTGAKAIICMCGYNTAMDVLQSQIPSVFVPFDDGGEVEQTLRAESLVKRAGITMVASDHATGASLDAALTKVINAHPKPIDPEHFDGAKGAVRVVESLLAARL